MLRKSLIVFVISVFLFSALALTDAYVSRGHKPPVAGIEVYDANGQYLGVLGTPSMVYVPSLSRFVVIRSDTGESRHIYLYFQSYDCTGTPYVEHYSAYLIGKSGEKYYTGAKTVPVEIEVHSMRGVECKNYGYGEYFVPAEEVPADSLPFTFPVALPLEFK